VKMEEYILPKKIIGASVQITQSQEQDELSTNTHHSENLKLQSYIYIYNDISSNHFSNINMLLLLCFRQANRNTNHISQYSIRDNRTRGKLPETNIFLHLYFSMQLICAS
jgi:restriction endonuclease